METSMNPLTLQGIAHALWMKEYDRSKIPADILARIEGEKNSERAYAERFPKRLDELEANPLSFAPPRPGSYAVLRAHVTKTMAMSPRAFYASCLFLGSESLTGYPLVPQVADFKWPEIDLPQLQHQLGWHFFVGNFSDAEGKHYSVEMMFWQYALLPPPLAAELGLSDIENQSLEMHLAICDAQTGVQYRSDTIVVAGTTGLVEVQARPFKYRLGRNSIEGLSEDGHLFPVRLQGRGYDLGQTPDVEFDVDLTLDNHRGYFLQGDQGLSPAVDGLGTLYYSAPLLKLREGVESAITIAGKRIVLTGGSMWFDHQWTAGFMPQGGMSAPVLRAFANLVPAGPGGWDWFEMQFSTRLGDGTVEEVQMTLAALHSAGNSDCYWHTGPTPPRDMASTFHGKFIDRQGQASDITGIMTVTAWVNVTATPNPAVFPPTDTWYPAKYAFTVEQELPAPLRAFTLTPLTRTGQTGFFGTGPQYAEGGAVVHDLHGQEVGRGFAEATNWARANDNIIGLAGLPLDAQTRALLAPVVVSPSLWWFSMVYCCFNWTELTRLQRAFKGLVSDGPPPEKA
jgi:predicted secreted hydrolase